MKITIRHSIWVLAGWLLLLYSCTKTGEVFDVDSLPAARIYIPAATNRIVVPSASAIYRIDSAAGKIYIPIGIGRSGIQSKESYTVNVSVANDTINQLISEGILNDVSLFTPDMYSLPSTFTVEANTDGGQLELAIDAAKVAPMMDKTLALAIRISDPSKYQLNSSLSTVVITFNYANIFGDPSFIDDYNGRAFTETYATILGEVGYETNANPAIMYDDNAHVNRRAMEQVEFTYSLSKIQKSIMGAKKLTGFKVNVLAFWLTIPELVTITYSTDGGKTFVPASNMHVDDLFIPEKGQNTWHDNYLQGALPAGVTDFKITILKQNVAGFPEWIPLLRRTELFYEGGTPYEYQNPLE